MKSKLCSVLVVMFLVLSLFANVSNGQTLNVIFSCDATVQTAYNVSAIVTSQLFTPTLDMQLYIVQLTFMAAENTAIDGAFIQILQNGSVLGLSVPKTAYLDSGVTLVDFELVSFAQLLQGVEYQLVFTMTGVNGAAAYFRLATPSNIVTSNIDVGVLSRGSSLSDLSPDNFGGVTRKLIFSGLGVLGGVTTTPPPTSTPTPAPTLTLSPPVIVPSAVEHVDLRFSDVERESFEHVGFGLNEKSGGVAVSVEAVYPGNVDVAFGFRVWLVGEGGFERELTGGVPVAVSTFLAAGGNFSGFVSSVWDCPAVSLALGGNALRVVLYSAAEDGANTVARAVFISPVLMSNQLVASSWTFTLHVDYELNGFVVSWSGRFGQAGIFGVVVSEPSPFDVMWFKLLGLDFFGFLLYPYVDTLGLGMFYVIVWVAILGAYYIWQQKVSGILLILVLFGSAGGVLFQFFPLPVMLLVWSLVTVGLGVLLFRLFR